MALVPPPLGMRSAGPVTGSERGLWLRNNVGGQLIFNKSYAVAQHQPAFLQALHLQDICTGGFLEGFDGRIEVAMLLEKTRQVRPKLAFFVFCHRCRCAARRAEEPPRAPKARSYHVLGNLAQEPAAEGPTEGIFTLLTQYAAPHNIPQSTKGERHVKLRAVQAGIGQGELAHVPSIASCGTTKKASSARR